MYFQILISFLDTRCLAFISWTSGVFRPLWSRDTECPLVSLSLSIFFGFQFFLGFLYFQKLARVGGDNLVFGI